jgi:GNAT superfamily N-acetyltransferase
VPIEIAQAAPSDHEAILELHREAGWPGTHVDGEVWAAREGAEILGGVQLLELAPGTILIDAAVVRSTARGRGVGTDMLRRVLATREADWWLECREERIGFYLRLAFHVERDADVPGLVKARVGPNATRRQFFLQRSTRTLGC